MSQFKINIIPELDDGVSLSEQLNTWRDAIHSTHLGPVRPDYATPGTIWVDDSVPGGWIIYIFDGEIDIPLSVYAGFACAVPFYRADSTYDPIPLAGQSCGGTPGGGGGSGGVTAGVEQIRPGEGISVAPSTGTGVVTVKTTNTIPFTDSTNTDHDLPLNP
jgi:hypothetical protein